METIKQLKKKQESNGPVQKIGSWIDTILERQIRTFRVIFGSITSKIAVDTSLAIARENIDLNKMIGTGIVWAILCFWFIATYKIEHWDEHAKSRGLNKSKGLENRLEMLSEIRRYTLDIWLPNASTDEERITILNALGKLMSFASVDDLKGDFAVIHTSIADSFETFLIEFKKVRSTIFQNMDDIMKKNQKKVVTKSDLVPDDPLFPKELISKTVAKRL